MALPDHTSCREIHRELSVGFSLNRTELLACEAGLVGLDYDNSRLRPRVDLIKAVDAIAKIARRVEPGIDYRERPALPEGAAEWLSWDRIAKEFLDEMKRDKAPKASLATSPSTLATSPEDGRMGQYDYYLEVGGGLGDAFNQLYHRGAYNVLRDLKDGERARVCIVSHNPFVKELFWGHPKRDQITVEDLGYWHTKEENDVNRAKHHMPGPGANGLLPEKALRKNRPRLEFWPLPQDADALLEVKRLRRLSAGPMIVVAATAGLPERSIPPGLLDTILAGIGPVALVVVVGREYERYGRTEWRPGKDRPALDLINQISVPATAFLVQACDGLVTCHSALNILAWHEQVPQLLLYPLSVYDRHIQHKDQWAFGVDYPECVHGTFDRFDVGMMARFWAQVKGVK